MHKNYGEIILCIYVPLCGLRFYLYLLTDESRMLVAFDCRRGDSPVRLAGDAHHSSDDECIEGIQPNRK